MAANKGTRELVREVVPALLAKGVRPTEEMVKQAIRETYPDLHSEWNPSRSTVTDEIQKVLVQIGLNEMNRFRIGGVPDSLQAIVSTFVKNFEDVVRQQLLSELSERTVQLEDRERVCNERVISAEDRAARAESASSVLRETLENERRLTARQQSDLQQLQLQKDAAEARCNNQDRQLAQYEEQIHNMQQRHIDEMNLSEHRYRELERLNLLEVDRVRQATVKLTSELSDQQRISEARRAQIDALREDLARAKGELDASKRLFEGQKEDARIQRENDHQRYADQIHSANIQIGALSQELKEIQALLAHEKLNSAELLRRNQNLEEQISHGNNQQNNTST